MRVTPLKAFKDAVLTGKAPGEEGAGQEGRARQEGRGEEGSGQEGRAGEEGRRAKKTVARKAPAKKAPPRRPRRRRPPAARRTRHDRVRARHAIGKTGGVRTAASFLLLLSTGLLVGGLAVGATVAGSRVSARTGDDPRPAPAAARADGADAPQPSAFTRVHDPFDADHGDRRADLAPSAAALAARRRLGVVDHPRRAPPASATHRPLALAHPCTTTAARHSSHADERASPRRASSRKGLR